jgi:2,3-bisphosphoglycerate-dependent phosphoglycerate mutase
MGRTCIQNVLPTAILDPSIGEDGWWSGCLKESDAEAKKRADSVINRMINSFGAGPTKVFAILHADLLKLMIGRMLFGVFELGIFGPFGNAAVTKLDFDGRVWRLDWLNSISHLTPKLMTGDRK